MTNYLGTVFLGIKDKVHADRAMLAMASPGNRHKGAGCSVVRTTVTLGSWAGGS